jgi:hypothetical protein
MTFLSQTFQVRMTQYQFLDELVREYLTFRGFTASLKAFDLDLKVEKEKGFRVDRYTNNGPI